MAVTLLEEGECQATELPLRSLALTRILSLDALPLGNSGVYKSSLRDGPVIYGASETRDLEPNQ